MMRTWWERSLGYIWALPVTVIGALLALIYLPRKVWWHDGCLEMIPRWMIGNPDGQTFGWIVYYRNEAERLDPEMRVHERVHTRQAMRGGIFFALSYAVHWIYYYIRLPKRVKYYHPRWFAAYMAVPYEVTAYRIQWAGKFGQVWGTKIP